MSNYYEEIDISVDDSFEALFNRNEFSSTPVASFQKAYIYLNRKAAELLTGNYVEVRKNDKYIVFLPSKEKARHTYKLLRGDHRYGCCVCAVGGRSSGFYSPLTLGKVFKVKKIKSGGIAICLEEEAV